MEKWIEDDDQIDDNKDDTDITLADWKQTVTGTRKNDYLLKKLDSNTLIMKGFEFRKIIRINWQLDDSNNKISRKKNTTKRTINFKIQISKIAFFLQLL